MQGAEEVAFVDDAVAVHDPYGQDPGIGRDLAHDARDERAVAGVRGSSPSSGSVVIGVSHGCLITWRGWSPSASAYSSSARMAS